MTHKKLLTEIIVQSKENTEQLNSELKEQVRKQTDEANQILLQSFSESYQSALEKFSEQAAKLQEQQQQKMLEIMEQFMSNTVQNQEKSAKIVNAVISSMRDDQHKKLDTVKQIVSDISTAIEVQNKNINNAWDDVKEKLNAMQQFVTDSIIDMKTIILEISENNQHMSTKIQESLDKQREITDSIKQTSGQAAEANYKLLKSFSNETIGKIMDIQSVLKDFAENQSRSNRQLKAEICCTLEESMDSIKEVLDESFERHQKEIIEIDKKIQLNTKEYHNQLKLITDTIEKSQELSSKDMAFLEKMVKGRGVK